MKIPSSTAAAELRAKAAFFRQLEALGRAADDDDDDVYDQTEERHREQCRAFQTAAMRKETQIGRSPLQPMDVEALEPGKPKRTVSAPTPFGTVSGRDQTVQRTPLAPKPSMTKRMPLAELDTSVVEDTPIVVPDSARQKQPESRKALQRSATTPVPGRRGSDSRGNYGRGTALLTAMDSPSVSTVMKKRKRDSAPKLVPEAERIFAGLAFYYIPDNDIAPARKIRIGKARDYGATWVRDIKDATHVVVDKSLLFQDVEGIIASVDVGVKRRDVAVVTEEYPIDCIQFRSLLNPAQKLYRVRGFPEATEVPSSVPAPPAASTGSNKSLELKRPHSNARTWDHVPPPGTPSRNQESSGKSSIQRLSESQTSLPGNPKVVVSPEQTSPSNDDTENLPPLAPMNGADELSRYIEEMKQFKDLPLDEDDEEDDDDPSVKDIDLNLDEEDGSEDERDRKKRATQGTSSRAKTIAWEDRFACNQAGAKDANLENLNARTIEVLQRMCDYYERVNDHWRITAYRKAIATLRRQPTKITTSEEAYKLPNIGHRLALKIEEIASTDRLKRLDYAQQEPLDEVLPTFLKIYGVGNSQANRWIAQGFRTLQDLREKAKLTPNQRLGVEHFDDLNTRIPRREVEALGEVVKRAAKEIDPQVELIIGGSYRRGSDSSGDIDFIVTKKGTTSSADLLPFSQRLIRNLDDSGFVVATLAASRFYGGGSDDGSKWHGCCVLPPTPGVNSVGNNNADYKPVWRRIDLLLVPETEIGAALIYFTGNDIFNRSIRLLASKKGMRLNQRGLYKNVARGPGRVKATEGELVEGRDEKRIFGILGVKWREPHERWC
jgi:DNA polymerase IV